MLKKCVHPWSTQYTSTQTLLKPSTLTGFSTVPPQVTMPYNNVPYHSPQVSTQLLTQTGYYELINIPKGVNSSNLNAHSRSNSAPQPKLNPTEFKNRKGLGFIHLNIRSIIQINKLDQPKILVTQTDPDIVILNET